jgi:ComF family protein
MQQLINNWSNINHLLLGRRCLLCAVTHREPHGVCKSCATELPRLPVTHCPQCALFSASGAVCGQCLQSPPAFDRTFAAFRYAYPLDSMLQCYKYQHQLHLAEQLAGLMLSVRTSETPTHHPPPDLIVPMPLHPHRLRERGFNQSLEIARHLATQLKIPLEANAAVRTRLSPPQASLPLKARVKNMKQAFVCTGRFDGLRIALVDDVMTTGASLNELSRTFKNAGAKQVECWVIARTLPG